MTFDWDPEKNQWLAEHRHITFEEIVALIRDGYLLAVLQHPAKEHQKIFVIDRDGYAVNVPFVEDTQGTCFLKTIYPSRVSTKKYVRGG